MRRTTAESGGSETAPRARRWWQRLRRSHATARLIIAGGAVAIGAIGAIGAISAMAAIEATGAIGTITADGAIGAIGARPVTSQKPAITVRVEADVYSGRPNPRWTLSAPDADTLLGRLRALPEAADAAEPRDGLGYRGMLVHIDPAAQGLCATVRVGHGLACCMPAPGAASPRATCRRDADRALERWLVSSGQSELEPGLLKMLTDQIKP